MDYVMFLPAYCNKSVQIDASPQLLKQNKTNALPQSPVGQRLPS